MIRGRFAGAPESVTAAHDALEQGAEAQAAAAGQVAHLVYAGREDPQDALMVDIWTSDTDIDAYYTDPTFESSLGALFDATGPNYGVYGSTDWVSW